MQAKHGNGNGHGKSLSIEANDCCRRRSLRQTPPSTSGSDGPSARHMSIGHPSLMRRHRATDIGIYADAIARWEHLTRPAPAPTQASKKGTPATLTQPSPNG